MENGLQVKIIADSSGPNGHRITTMLLKYQRFIHSEFMTHRMLSKNAASSRAIPVAKIIDSVMTDPAMPVFWGKQQAGMQADQELSGEALEAVKTEWLKSRDSAVASVNNMLSHKLHKQI